MIYFYLLMLIYYWRSCFIFRYFSFIWIFIDSPLNCTVCNVYLTNKIKSVVGWPIDEINDIDEINNHVFVDSCVSQLIRLICCSIILTAIHGVCWSVAHLPSSPSLTDFLRSSEVYCLLLHLDPYDSTDLVGTFHLFLKRMADVVLSTTSPCGDLAALSG